jgi:hypothetical protein
MPGHTREGCEYGTWIIHPLREAQKAQFAPPFKALFCGKISPCGSINKQVITYQIVLVDRVDRLNRRDFTPRF